MLRQAAQHQQALFHINPLRQLLGEDGAQGRRRGRERQLLEAEPFVERPVERDESEGGEADAFAAGPPGCREHRPDQRRADAAAAMDGIDRKLAQMEKAGERAGDGVAGGRVVVLRDGDPDLVAV